MVASKDLTKQVVMKMKWLRQLQAAKSRPWPSNETLSQAERLQRYTNFSLHHIWEKNRYLQTHLLVREACLFTMHDAPSLLDPDIPHYPGTLSNYEHMASSKKSSH